MSDRAATGALMNALHAWPGWTLTRRLRQRDYQCMLWFSDDTDSRTWVFDAPTMSELAVLVDRCRLENPRPSLEVKGDPERAGDSLDDEPPHKPPLGARCN